jgi:hypothetical protein
MSLPEARTSLLTLPVCPIARRCASQRLPADVCLRRRAAGRRQKNWSMLSERICYNQILQK